MPHLRALRRLKISKIDKFSFKIPNVLNQYIKGKFGSVSFKRAKALENYFLVGLESSKVCAGNIIFMSESDVLILKINIDICNMSNHIF